MAAKENEKREMQSESFERAPHAAMLSSPLGDGQVAQSPSIESANRAFDGTLRVSHYACVLADWENKRMELAA